MWARPADCYRWRHLPTGCAERIQPGSAAWTARRVALGASLQRLGSEQAPGCLIVPNHGFDDAEGPEIVDTSFAGGASASVLGATTPCRHQMTDHRLPLAELAAKSGDPHLLRALAESVLPLNVEADVVGLIGAGRYER